MLILPPQAEPRPQLQGSIGLMEYFLLLTEDSNLSEVLVLYWASITTCISSVTMVGFSNWAKYNKILSLAQVFTVSEVQALLLVCTMSKVHTATNCRSANTLGCFLLFKKAEALARDKMYCLGVWLVVVDTLKTVANSLRERSLYLSAGQSKYVAMLVMETI